MALITVIISSDYFGDDIVNRWELGKLEGRLKHSTQELKWAH